MLNVRCVHIAASLVRGRVRRLVETANGELLVQVWSGAAWEPEPSGPISATEVRRGIDAPPRVLRALGVPECDWPTPAPASGPSRHPPVTVFASWSLLEWVAPVLERLPSAL